MADRGLNPKQRRFVEEYVRSLNASDAYNRAYGAKSSAVARAAGSRLLAHVNIKAAVDEAMAERARRVELSQDWVVRRLMKAACRKDEAASHAASVSALVALGKHLGMFLDRTRHETDPANPPEVKVTVADELAPYADVVRGLVAGSLGAPPDGVPPGGAGEPVDTVAANGKAGRVPPVPGA